MMIGSKTCSTPRYLCASNGVHRVRGLNAFLEAEIIRQGVFRSKLLAQAVLAWGRKPSALKAEALALGLGLPLLRLEDGFLRSFGTGENFPPLSLVVDDQGIYYDSTCASALEALLASDVDVLEGIAADVARARALVLAHRLSKYNHAADWELGGAFGVGFGFGGPSPQPSPRGRGS